ncbi:unnamed protein product [Gulo gulo]|uniref:Uncharacterized protein n=1 Tax=Gulo gulo TaxID=48420 RepID=A0A9X9Q6J4_GULGU|nr:unnamed protein product [Gulo gulo]
MRRAGPETPQTRDPEQLGGGEVGVFLSLSLSSRWWCLKYHLRPRDPRHPAPRFPPFPTRPRVGSWREAA